MSFTIGVPVENTSSTTTVVCTVAGVPAGASIVVLVDWNNGSGAITISGVADGQGAYALQGSSLANASGRSSSVYLLANANSGSHTITCTFAGGSGAAYMTVWYVNGVAGTDGFNQAINNFPGAATTFNCPSVTTTTAGDLVLGLVANGDASCTFTLGATYTTIGLATNGYFGEYVVNGAAGAVTPPLKESINDPNNTFTLTFKAAAAGTQYLVKWLPFRWAAAMRSLQQGINNVGNRQQNRLALAAAAITQANGAATWAKWRVGKTSTLDTNALLLDVPLVPGFVPPVGTVDDGT